MPILIRSIDREHHQLDAVAFGPIHYAEIETHLVEERNIDGLTYKEVIDARDADLVFALSPTEIRTVIALVRNLSQQSKFGPTAVLVATDYARRSQDRHRLLVRSNRRFWQRRISEPHTRTSTAHCHHR